MAEEESASAAAGGANLTSAALVSSATGIVGSGSGVDIDALVARLLKMVDTLESEVKDTSHAPSTAAPSKAADKVEIMMVTDTAGTVCATAKKNTDFVIIDASGDEITTIKSPLTMFEETLDITKVSGKDKEILAGINTKLLNKDATIKPFIDAQKKLPDNSYAATVHNALEKYKKFYEKILELTTLQNLTNAKAKLGRIYTTENDKQKARKTLELLYTPAFKIAVEAHDMLVSAAEDYFNTYIVYHDASKSYDDSLSEKIKGRDLRCSKELVSTQAEYDAVISDISTTYGKNPESFMELFKQGLDNQEYQNSGITISYIELLERIKSDTNIIEIKKIKDKVLQFESVPVPSQQQIDDISAALHSFQFPTIKPMLTNYQFLLTFFNNSIWKSVYKLWNDYDKRIDVFYNNATLPTKLALKADYDSNRLVLEQIKEKLDSFKDRFLRRKEMVSTALEQLGELEQVEAIISGGVTKQNAEAAATQTQRTLDMPVVDPIVSEWKTFFTTIDVSFNTLPLPTGTNKTQYDALKIKYMGISSEYNAIDVAKNNFDLAKTLAELSDNKNIISRSSTLNRISILQREFNTVYSAYFTVSRFAETVQLAEERKDSLYITAKETYVNAFLTELLNGRPAHSLTTPIFIKTIVNTAKTGGIADGNFTTTDISNSILIAIGTHTLTQLADDIQLRDAAAAATLTTFIAAAPPADGLQKFVNNYINGTPAVVGGAAAVPGHPLPERMRGGSRHRVTRRRRTGSKRLRKTRARK